MNARWAAHLAQLRVFSKLRRSGATLVLRHTQTIPPGTTGGIEGSGSGDLRDVQISQGCYFLFLGFSGGLGRLGGSITLGFFEPAFA